MQMRDLQGEMNLKIILDRVGRVRWKICFNMKENYNKMEFK